MALGGGNWISQNKTLPGTYINFVSTARASSSLSERGIAAMPLVLSWGPDGEVFTVTAEQFQKDSMKLFGYPYGDDHLKGVTDLFRNIRQGVFYKVNSGGTAAANKFAAAKYKGARGNDLKIVIEQGAGYAADSNEIYNVLTYLGTTLVDQQDGVKTMGELADNDYVSWQDSAALELTASTPLTGGEDGTADTAAYQAFLDKIDGYTFNALGCASTDEAVKALFADFTKTMRDSYGVKFQTVLFQYEEADYEGIISVENPVAEAQSAAAGMALVGSARAGESGEESGAVYWTTGAEAGCPVNKDLTNTVYGGSFTLNTDYTQAQLEEALKSGKLIFHRVGDEIRVLEDINTFVSVTDEKSEDFGNNQVIRVLDQIGNDIAALFNGKYLGKVPNDDAGRISLWNDIVEHHRDLQDLRAIENFDPEDVAVAKGETKTSVVVTDQVTPVSAMRQLYMTVIVM